MLQTFSYFMNIICYGIIFCLILFSIISINIVIYIIYINKIYSHNKTVTKVNMYITGLSIHRKKNVLICCLCILVYIIIFIYSYWYRQYKFDKSNFIYLGITYLYFYIGNFANIKWEYPYKQYRLRTTIFTQIILQYGDRT